MSEYQYYEFRAFDRPLSKAQVQEVERCSTRAQITSRSFVNVYNYGSFRGDEWEFLIKHFDAMVYVANWGTHRFMFRVPQEVIDIEQARKYAVPECVEVRPAGQNIIFLVQSLEEGGGGWVDGEGWMEQLAPLREELIAGDLRVLYLAWLGGMQSARDTGYVAEENVPEPPVPPGLGKLTAAQKAFVEFLRVDQDMLKAAAQASTDAKPAAKEDMAAWIAALPQARKDQALLDLAEGRDPHAGVTLLRQFQAELARKRPADQEQAGRRTFGELSRIAEELGKRREEAEARKRAKERAALEVRQAAEKAARLAALASRVPEAWREVEDLIATKVADAYDRAAATLGDLRDLAAQQGSSAEYSRQLADLRDRHRAKSSLMRKLKQAGV